MNSVLLYIYYDKREYDYFFSAVIDDERVFHFAQIYELRKLFDKLNEKGYVDANINWCIISDLNSTEFNFSEFFNSYQHKLHHNVVLEKNAIFRLIEKHFDEILYIHDGEDIFDKIKILYPNEGDYNIEEHINHSDDLLDKVKVLLDTDSPKKTELSRIIEEYYNEV
jgi:hypothetical protein